MLTMRETEEFVAWLDALTDKRAQIRIVARLRQVDAGNLGDWKPIEGAMSVMRVEVGTGYRLFFTRRGTVLIILLTGGNKASQKRDIRRAAVGL